MSWRPWARGSAADSPGASYAGGHSGTSKETTGEGTDAKVLYEIVIEKGTDKLEVQFDPEGKFLGEEKLKK
ncbi:MAG TPA: hypothetical protein VKE74_17630 [Gemmataceae bacterium]|nr:hypothetical protein [Gemmataceae bacterium]